jgi:hypothetical protein
MRLLMPAATLAFIVALALPARAQQGLAPSPENPYLLRANGHVRRNTGIALMVLGSLNLAVAVGVGLGMGLPSSYPRGCPDCGLGYTAMLSITIPSAVVGGTLLGVGIPLYVQGDRAVHRASRELAESPGAFSEAEALRPHPERDRKLGTRLLIAGALSLSVGLAGSAGVFATIYSRPFNPAALDSTLCLSAVGGGLGIILLSTGGSYLSRARRAERSLRLSLRLGTSIALAGEM